MPIRRRTAAEENEFLLCDDLMPCTCRDQHRVPRADRFHLAINLHPPAPAEHIVELLALLMVMPLRRATNRQPRFCEALVFHWRVRGVQQAGDRRAVLGRERLLRFSLSDFHSLSIIFSAQGHHPNPCQTALFHLIFKNLKQHPTLPKKADRYHEPLP